MTLQLPIPPDTEAKLREQAAAAGKELTNFVLEALEEKLAGSSGVANANNGIDDPDRWLDEISEGLPELSPLPRGFSTEDIYVDHD